MHESLWLEPDPYALSEVRAKVPAYHHEQGVHQRQLLDPRPVLAESDDIAFTIGLTLSICFRWAPIASPADKSFARIRFTISTAVIKHISVLAITLSFQISAMLWVRNSLLLCLDFINELI